MKKILLSALMLAAATTGFSQAFFTQTNYRGAFAPAPTSQWTDGWCEWSPGTTTVYAAPTATVTGTISASTTWSTGQTVLLQGPVYVTNNSTLTIQPGVVIRGSKQVAGSALIITRGSKIMAAGTSTSPIVFTSSEAPNSRAVGDWGGLIVLGKATINFTTGVNNIEGLPVSPETTYGGGGSPDDNDNSGTLQYVRIEFGGYVYGTNQEINGLTMGGVGKGTTIDHVQVSFTNDDGFEWFGGNVNAKWLVSYRNLDDDFDTDNGWKGNVQYGLIVRDPNLADNPAVSTSEGFESDNDAGGTTATPLTSGIFSNITMVGPFRGSNTNTIAAGYRRALRIRRNSNLKIYNSIFMDTQRGIFIDGAACASNATVGTSGASMTGLKFKSNTIAGTQNGRITENSGTVTPLFTGTVVTDWYAQNGNDSITNANPTFTNILVAPYSYTAGDYRPTANSPLLTAGTNFTDAPIAALTNTVATGITEVKKEIGYVMVYPNPANEVSSLLINADHASEIDVKIFDITGKLAMMVLSNGRVEEGVNEIEINTSNLQTGVYFVMIESMHGKETVKLIVTK